MLSVNKVNLKYFSRLLAIALVSEVLVMLLLSYYIHVESKLLEALLDAALLVFISFPFVMKYVINPFSIEMSTTIRKELKSKIDALQKKDKMMIAQSRQAAMGDMIGMIAHQWRQPLASIGMGAQNMQLDIELGDIDPKRFDEKLSKIVEKTHFLSQTIDDFSDFLKPEKKGGSCSLSKMVDGTLSIVEKSLDNNKITVNKSYENDIDVTTYCNAMVQVLLNIINNAQDILKQKEIKDASIDISLSHDNEMASITVTDNAGGIPKDIIDRIFEPYFTTKEERGGAGLGLYMSHMIVKKHLKGLLYVKNIDGGASFKISFPIKS